jgi:predicted dienelactone hydrolase
VVVFSHGQAALRWQSTYYTLPLASHGYVVLAPDHEEGTLGDVVRNQLQSTAAGVVDRPADVLYLLNRLYHLKADDFLNGLVDPVRFGVTGHSFGGLTSLRVAVLDSRVKVIVPQAPTSTDVAWLGLADAGVSIPVMLQAAHEDKTLEWDTNAAVAWNALKQPRWLFDVTHGGHFTFSILCELDLATLAKTANFSIPGTNIDNVLTDGCGPTAPKASVAEPLIDHFAIGTFNTYLRNSPGSKALLDQAHADALTPGVVQITSDPGQ